MESIREDEGNKFLLSKGRSVVQNWRFSMVELTSTAGTHFFFKADAYILYIY